MEGDKYIIKTLNFEGPFSLLLSLVEQRKLFINEISLSEVTEDYLKYISDIEKYDRKKVSNFIIIASTLILIKSKSLLPVLNLSSEEEEDIKNLENRLKLYGFYTNLSKNIKKKFGKKIIFQAEERKKGNIIFLPDSQITKEKMMILAGDLVNKLPKKEILPEVEIKKVITIEEMIDKLTDKIKNSLEFKFNEFTGRGIENKDKKVSIIIGFLAMLELVRNGILNVIQDNNFEDIIIKNNQVKN